MTTSHHQRPERLYHYTTIEALALILKTRTIRLQSLDKLNDPSEEVSQEGGLGKYVFVTCWTSEQQEFLPYWYMYGHRKTGVRISMPTDFFKHYELREQFHDISGDVSRSGRIFEGLIPESDLLQSDYLVANYVAESNTFFPIEYTDEQRQLEPRVFSYHENGALETALGRLGQHKPTIWSFEKEWRFRLIIHPYGFREIDPLNPIVARRAIEEKKNLQFSNYFLQIADDHYSKMGITLGPLCSGGDEAIVEALTRQYNPTAAITRSVLTGKVR